MAAASSSVVVVIKVKYEDTLRRFRAQIIDGELSLTADELRKKIVSLFEFSSDTEIMLTYIDEDGDTVTIVDSVDLSDVVNQCLNPIRFTVEPVSKDDSRKFNPSGSFSRRRSSDLPCENDDARKFSLPEPTFETLERVIDDLISKYGIVNIADHLSIVSESVSKRAKEEKHYPRGSFHPLDLLPTHEKDATRENNSSGCYPRGSFHSLDLLPTREKDATRENNSSYPPRGSFHPFDLLPTREKDATRENNSSYPPRGSFHPLDLPPTRERDAVRENNSSASFDPLTFLSHEHRQQHRRPFGNAKESVNTFPYPS